MEYLKQRISERSTWLGLGLAIGGIGQVAKIDEAPAVAQVVTDHGPALALAALRGDWATLAQLAVGVVLAILPGTLRRAKQ